MGWDSGDTSNGGTMTSGGLVIDPAENDGKGIAGAPV